MKLSDFKDEKAVEVVANLLVPICKIVANRENAAARKGTRLEFATALLKNNSAEVLEILAILNDQDPKEYHCTGASLMMNLFEVISDPEIMQLFGLQGKTTGPTCSGAQSENTAAPEQ